MCLFEVWKGFASKLDVYTRDIRTATFRYFKHLKAFSVDHQVNSVEINMFAPVMFLCFCIGGIRGMICFCIRGSTSQFCTKFQDFQHFGSLFSFLIKPESSEDLSLCAFEWMDIEDFQLQLIDFKASLLWTSKFVDLRKSLETIENKQKTF